MDELQDHYPWASLGNATVVDVGGGNGHVSVALGQVSSSSTNNIGN